MQVPGVGQLVAAFIATAFAQDHADAAKAQWRQRRPGPAQAAQARRTAR